MLLHGDWSTVASKTVREYDLGLGGGCVMAMVLAAVPLRLTITMSHMLGKVTDLLYTQLYTTLLYSTQLNFIALYTLIAWQIEHQVTHCTTNIMEIYALLVGACAFHIEHCFTPLLCRTPTAHCRLPY